MEDNFDYLTWWNSLEGIWKKMFELNIRINIDIMYFNRVNFSDNELTVSSDELTEEKKILLEYNHNETFEKNRNEIKILAIKYLIRDKEMTVNGFKDKFKFKDLNPLKLFSDLEEIKFINAEVNNIDALYSLKKIKLLDFTRAKVNFDEIHNYGGF